MAPAARPSVRVADNPPEQPLADAKAFVGKYHADHEESIKTKELRHPSLIRSTTLVVPPTSRVPGCGVGTDRSAAISMRSVVPETVHWIDAEKSRTSYADAKCGQVGSVSDGEGRVRLRPKPTRSWLTVPRSSFFMLVAGSGWRKT